MGGGGLERVGRKIQPYRSGFQLTREKQVWDFFFYERCLLTYSSSIVTGNHS